MDADTEGPMRYYRATLLVCVLAWFMVGLHMPALHDMTHHGGLPGVPVIAAVAFLVIVAAAALLVLLRAPVTISNEAS
jgi:hypothetical protein